MHEKYGWKEQLLKDIESTRSESDTAIDEYFDLILLDVKLPGNDGLKVLEQLKKAKLKRNYSLTKTEFFIY